MSKERRMLVVILMLVLGGAACGGAVRENGSETATVYESLDLALATAEAVQLPAAQAMLSLAMVIPDPEGGERGVYPLCSGFRVAKDILVTAAHCQRPKLLANPFFLAAPAPDSAAAAAYEVMPVGASVRLLYLGEVDRRHQEYDRQGSLLGAPLFVDDQLDVAIYRLDGAAQGAWIALPAAVSPAGEAQPAVKLWAYPNGTPLSSATCTSLLPSYGPWLAHDCDALSGSSGGLIASMDGRQAIAIHLAGPRANAAAYYQQHGQFETPLAIAQSRGCGGGEGQVLDPACVARFGMNRALPLTALAQRLQESSPGLWDEMVQAAEAAATELGGGSSGLDLAH